ncbi:hypothetical protein FOA52_002341 [Chlamydomonas sp. UWO 241]|nr:hypothetical protein FOA52_002341 [Chlamydomonas sp. UWO 241]
MATPAAAAKRAGSKRLPRLDKDDDTHAYADTNTKNPWSTAFTLRIKGFSMLSEPVWSECFECGIATWRLWAYPKGLGVGKDTHLSVYLEAQDAMWAPAAEYKFTLVNQADGSKSHSTGDKESTFDRGESSCHGVSEFFKLSSLRRASAGWLVNDTLVLTVDVTVQREDRFQLDAGDAPCNVVLRLPCGVTIPVISHLLPLASPFFRDALEGKGTKGRDTRASSAAISVDGSLGTWTYILADLYPQYDPPALSLDSVYRLLPVVHKYAFTKLLSRLVAFVKEKGSELDHYPEYPTTYVIRWLALAEHLQLDELIQLGIGRLRGMTRKQLQMAITSVVVGEAGRTQRIVRDRVKQLGQELRDTILAIAASDQPSPRQRS